MEYDIAIVGAGRTDPAAEDASPCHGASMTDDLDLYRAAKLLIDQHGADAGLRAAERANKLLEDGDMTELRQLGGNLARAAGPPAGLRPRYPEPVVGVTQAGLVPGLRHD